MRKPQSAIIAALFTTRIYIFRWFCMNVVFIRLEYASGGSNYPINKLQNRPVECVESSANNFLAVEILLFIGQMFTENS